MKSKIIIISVVLIGFVLALTANSWAQRERGAKDHGDRGGHFQKWNKPAIHKFDRDRRGGFHPKPYRHRYRPVHRHHTGFYKRYHRRAPHRYWHKYRHWRHRPHYRHGHPQWHHWRHPRAAVIHNYYNTAERYADSEESFHASASVSENEFSFSVGGSQTN